MYIMVSENANFVILWYVKIILLTHIRYMRGGEVEKVEEWGISSSCLLINQYNLKFKYEVKNWLLLQPLIFTIIFS